MKQAFSFILITVLFFGTALPAVPKQDPGTILFKTKEPTPGMYLNYGKKAMEEKLYKNAQLYFKTYLDKEAQTTEGKAEGTAQLARAYLKDNEPQHALDAINDYLNRYGIPQKGVTRNLLYLTGGQACINIPQKDYATALNFLEPLLSLSTEELGQPRAEVLDAIAAVWNATGCWEKTQQLLEEEINNGGLVQDEFHRLTWRRLEAAFAQGDWQKTRDFVAQLTAPTLNEKERLRLRLTSILCDIGEGNLENALNDYKAQNLANIVPTESSQQWWDVLSKLADACQKEGGQADADQRKEKLTEAAELYGKAKAIAPTKQQEYYAASKQAQALRDIGKRDEAGEILASLHEREPDNHEVSMLLGEILRDREDFWRACELFQKVADGDKTIDRSLRYKASLETANCFDSQGLHVPQAQKYYLLAAELADSSNAKAEAKRLAAQQLENAGDIPGAIKCFIETADTFGDAVFEAVAARLEAGRLLELQGAGEAAIEQYTKFLATNPPENSSLRWQAEIGIGKATKDPKAGSESLLNVALICADDEKLRLGALKDSFMRALEMEGAKALDQAIHILDTYQEKYPAKNSVLCELSYRLVVLALQNDSGNAFDWGKKFLEAYRETQEAPEIALRLGDACVQACQNPTSSAQGPTSESQDNEKNISYTTQKTNEALHFYRQVAKFPNVNANLRRLALYEEAVLSCTLPNVTIINKVTPEDGNETEVVTTEDGQTHALNLLNKIIEDEMPSIDSVKDENHVADLIGIRAFFLQGDILTTQNKTENALKAYETALKAAETQAPDLKPPLLGRRAELYYSQQKYDEALNDAEAIVNDPALKGRALLICARCHREKGEIAKAINCYNAIRYSYEGTLENTLQDATSPNIYFNAFCELLAIFEVNDFDVKSAQSIRGTYNKLRQAGHNLPPLPPPADSKNNFEKH